MAAVKAEDMPEEELAPDMVLSESELAALAAAEEAERQRISFERSLAGPSVGKAGLMRDQTEVNRIIAEASKGSKFYLNQKRKDEELTEKIAWFKAKRDELMSTSSVAQLESEADRILVEVEATRDLSQSIVHVDMDAFYAAVEVKRDPSLKGKAFGVGKGVLTTASYEARKFGCRSGMATFIAKKLCPHIVLTNLHFDLYSAASTKVREVLVKYDENLMMAGLDEGYLNITPYMKTHGMTATEVVTQLRAEVEAHTGMTISAGIAPNRMLAKICSDQNKPNGQFEIEFERAAIVKFMRDLPIRKIPGFGRVTERCLEGLGVEICGDVYTRRAELLAMNHWFGFRGLCKAHLGIAGNTVEPHQRSERKSVGVERTFADKTRDEEILRELESIAEELEKDLAATQYAGKTVTVKFKMHTYENKTRAHSVKKYLTKQEEILPIAVDLIRKEFPLRIRLLGIRMSNLKDLTVPETGIKNFLAKPGTSNSANASCSSSRELETVDITGLASDDEEDNAYVRPKSCARSRSRSLSRVSTPGVVAEDLEPKDGPMCPVCNRHLGAGTSNAALNEHIDLCLNRDACSATPSPRKRGAADHGQRGTSKRPRGKAKGKGRGNGGSVLDWLRRGQ